MTRRTTTAQQDSIAEEDNPDPLWDPEAKADPEGVTDQDKDQEPLTHAGKNLKSSQPHTVIPGASSRARLYATPQLAQTDP